MNPHDVFACGVMREVADTDGCQSVIVSTCIHGRSATVLASNPGAPSRPKPQPAVSEPATRGRPSAWTPVREAKLAADWNARVPLPMLLSRYALSRGGLDTQVSKMRSRGIPMVSRKGQYYRLPRGPSDRAREAHALAAAGAFGRVQLR